MINHKTHQLIRPSPNDIDRTVTATLDEWAITYHAPFFLRSVTFVPLHNTILITIIGESN